MNRQREQTGEMMGQREGQKVEKLPFKLDLNFCESREEREVDEKFSRRQTFLLVPKAGEASDRDFVFLAPQSGALRISAYRDFLPSLPLKAFEHLSLSMVI